MSSIVDIPVIPFTAEQAREEVSIGVRFFMSVGLFNWAKRIDWTDFDAAHPRRCPLGQVFEQTGGYDVGFWAFVGWKHDLFPKSTGGFMLPPGVDTDGQAWALINEEWRRRAGIAAA